MSNYTQQKFVWENGARPLTGGDVTPSPFRTTPAHVLYRTTKAPPTLVEAKRRMLQVERFFRQRFFAVLSVISNEFSSFRQQN